MKNHYLFFVSVAYSYPILRPLQEEIRRRGDEVAWFIEPGCPVLLENNEKWLRSVQAVLNYNPVAVFAPGNYIYDFFPGVKVCLFHGYPINKRGDEKDDHFSVRGWFDVYCTQGASSTLPFKELEDRYGFFKVYETGWCKADAFVKERTHARHNERPVIMYSSTFTKSITSAPYLLETITELAKKKEWDWIISFHPKYDDPKVIKKYKELAAACPNVTFHEGGVVNAEFLNQADVLLCDASSVIVEFMLLDKPVVTYNNTMPGNHLLNVTEPEDVESAIEKAITRPAKLMENIRLYVDKHEAHLDGNSSSRVLDAVNNYIWYFQGKTRTKPLNLVRKAKLRIRIGYPLMASLRLW